jgi:AraC family transcriptional regulator of adaptative response/methylated-DNA-[protein]-cysteine methyltransferase
MQYANFRCTGVQEYRRLSMKWDEERMYRALLEKDASFEGAFFVGVKTTGIFCRPTCAAKKPKRENVEFYPSAREAILSGYRPCRKCRPLEIKEKTPDCIERVLNLIDRAPHRRFKDSELREKGLDPIFLRRWFKRFHGLTFQAYLRSLRIGLSLKQIQNGEKVTDVAFDHGYESLSGFTGAFKKNIGNSPKKDSTKNIIRITRFQTPIGQMLAGGTEQGICLLEFADRRMLETELGILRRLLNAHILYGVAPHFKILEKELLEYFAGNRKEFSVPLVSPGTAFQQKVWNILRAIPYGATRSYRQQADIIGNPQAVRAVAGANGDNRIAIIIPCHRVIGENGKMVGYGGGIWRKQYLLDLEKGSFPPVSISPDKI